MLLGMWKRGYDALAAGESLGKDSDPGVDHGHQSEGDSGGPVHSFSCVKILRVDVYSCLVHSPDCYYAATN